MARALWKGSISFGLVNIPVSLVSASSSEELHFRMLDKHDLSPIHLRRVNEKSGKEVAWEDTVKGYERKKNDFVVLTDADFKRANVEATQTVEIIDFVEQSEVEPTYYDTPYFLEPLKPGRKAYALLRETLRRSGRVGIARVVIRTRQHLAMLLPIGRALYVEILRYPHELRDPKDLDLPGDNLEKEGVSAKELALAEKLVAEMAGKWRPEKYKDEYRDDLLALIKKKVAAGEGKTIDDSAPPARPRRAGNVVDLMPLLQESLAASKGTAPAEKGRRKARPAARAAARPTLAARKSA